MFKKIFIYFFLFGLTGCLSSGSGNGIREVVSGGSHSSNISGENSEDTSGNRGESIASLKMKNLTRVSDLSSYFDEENKSRITLAFKNYNLLNPSDKLKVTSTEFDYANNILIKQEYLKQIEILNASLASVSDKDKKLEIKDEILGLLKKFDNSIISFPSDNDFESLINDYKNEYNVNNKLSILNDFFVQYNIYEKEKSDLEKLTKNFLEKSLGDFVATETKSQEKLYSEWLQNNDNITLFKRSNFQSDAEYITAVESKLLTYIKALNGYENYTNYSDAYSVLKSAINAKNQSLTNTIEPTILTILKKLDNSVVSFPLSIKNVANYYLNQRKILQAVKDTVLILSPQISPNEAIKTFSYGDDEDEKVAKFVYNEALGDYVLNLRETSKSGNNKVDGEVIFKASDFSKKGNVFIASSVRKVDEILDFYTFMPNLKNYIYGGGSISSEISARRSFVKSLLAKVKNKTASTDEINTVNGWFQGVGFDYNNTKAVDLIEKLLSQSLPDFTFDKVYHITDTVKLGGEVVGLSFADFGMWEVKGVKSFIGDNNIISSNLNENLKTETYFVDYPFYSGIESLKTGYIKDVNLNAGSTITFLGNTFGVVEKIGKDETIKNVRQYVDGSAKFVIDDNSVKGNLTLSFEKWYGLKFDNIDLSNPDFSLSNTKVLLTNSSGVSGIKFGNKESLVGNLNGTMYGYDTGKPLEAVGMYNISSPDVGGTDIDKEKYNSISLTGVFGVKK